jgi:hypothetical protein
VILAKYQVHFDMGFPRTSLGIRSVADKNDMSRKNLRSPFTSFQVGSARQSRSCSGRYPPKLFKKVEDQDDAVLQCRGVRLFGRAYGEPFTVRVQIEIPARRTRTPTQPRVKPYNRFVGHK